MPVFDVMNARDVAGDAKEGKDKEEYFADQDLKTINEIYNNKHMVQACRFRIKWKDIFNVKEFYRAMHEWFDEYGWKDMEDGKDHYETLYFEKTGVAADKELWNRWRPQKDSGKLFRYHMDLDFHYLYLVKTEIVHEGKKLNKDIYKGEVEVWITALIEMKFYREWLKHPILKYFPATFYERLMRHDIFDERRRELYREAYILQNYIKQWFKLKKFLPYEDTEPFPPSEAYPSYTKGE